MKCRSLENAREAGQGKTLAEIEELPKTEAALVLASHWFARRRSSSARSDLIAITQIFVYFWFRTIDMDLADEYYLCDFNSRVM
jgi:hypothetical protein